MQSSPLPVQKAEMKVRITMPPKDGKRLGEQVRGLSAEGGIEEDEMSAEEWEIVSAGLSAHSLCANAKRRFSLALALHRS